MDKIGLGLLVWLLLPATLQAATPLGLKEQNVNAPAIIIADVMRYDPNSKIVEAEGNVEITQDGRIVLARKIIYNQVRNTVYAEGNVKVLEPDGQVYFAEQVELEEKFNTGAIDGFRARLADRSRLAANKATKISPTVTEMEQAIYSPCSLCKKNPQKAPLWQIKADKVQLDEAGQRIKYSEAELDFYGIPLLYTPYFSHPTPGADNKSGFLPPTYSSINTLGATVQVPYYISIYPYMDATVAPMFTADEGTVLTGEFRHLTQRGKYELSGSITEPDRRDEFGNRIRGKETRGHIEGSGFFDLEEDWAWGFSGKRASDDTYLRRYKLGFEDSLTSTAFVHQIRKRDFIGARGLTFQGLNAEDDPATTPFVLPLLQAHVESTPGYSGSRFFMDANSMVLYRSEGPQSRRLSISGGYTLPFITTGGHVFRLTSQLRGDVYSVENTGVADEDTTPSRLIPELIADWSYPMLNRFSWGHISLEPLLSLVASPYGGNPDSIPNEDSQNFELSDMNLFSPNKFTGEDRLEEGPRASYGIRTGIASNDNLSLNLLLGQSYRTRANNQLYQGSGLEDTLSNYVGRVDFSDNKWVDAAYSFRISEDNSRFERSEAATQLFLDPLTLGVDYLFLNRNPRSLLSDDREEISGQAALQVHQYWKVLGNIRRGLGQTEQNGGLISSGLGLLFENECLHFTTIFNREYTRDRDIEPSTSVVFQVKLANLH